MTNLTNVSVTAGIPTTGTGTVSTIDALMADGGQATLGATTDAKNTATNGTSVTGISIWKQISASVQLFVFGAGTAAAAQRTTLASDDPAVATLGAAADAAATQGSTGSISAKLRTATAQLNTIASALAGSLTVGAHAVTGSGNFSSTVADGANVTLGAKADAKSTATDTTAITAMSVWKQISASVQAAAASLAGSLTISGAVTNTALTNFGAGEYETVAASQTTQSLGATGAAGDWIDGLLVVPATTAPGNVLLRDGAGSDITLFAGGASSVSNLVPFFIPLGMISGSGAWKVTTGSNVSCIGIGNFT
jgi:hypothetical protein